jgi:AcrR family transcriptional regulator
VTKPIGCLVDYGHAGTTVTRIAERAGVTRGAQVHHYRTKDDLVTAAVTHLASKGAQFGWSQIARVVDTADPVGELLDAVVTAMDAMRGLLISAWHLPARQRSARWHRARERLRLLFPPPEQVVAAVRRVTAGGRD